MRQPLKWNALWELSYWFECHTVHSYNQVGLLLWVFPRTQAVSAEFHMCGFRVCAPWNLCTIEPPMLKFIGMELLQSLHHAGFLFGILYVHLEWVLGYSLESSTRITSTYVLFYRPAFPKYVQNDCCISRGRLLHWVHHDFRTTVFSTFTVSAGL